MKCLALLLALAVAVPPQGFGIRFHCLITGARDLDHCCCTGSTTVACGVPEAPAAPKSCSS